MTNNKQNQQFPQNMIPKANGYIITMPSTNRPYGNVSQIPIAVNPLMMNRPVFDMNSILQDQISSSMNTQSNPSSSYSSGPVSPQYTENSQHEIQNDSGRKAIVPENLKKRTPKDQKENSVKLPNQQSLTEAQRKQKETNLRIYTRLFGMWLLRDFGYIFTVKNKRHQSGKKVLYSISKIILRDTNEELVNRAEREKYAKEMISNGVETPSSKKTVEKFVDECIDNMLLEFLEMAGYSFETKMSSMFRDAKKNEDLLKFKKYTLLYIDVKVQNSVKRLTREAIYEEYKNVLDEFAESLGCD